MKAIEISGWGLDKLAVVDRPAADPGPGEVRLAMQAASLNYRDLLTVLGIYSTKYQLPLIPLSDGCGVIDAVGEGVADFNTGDRVCPLFFQDWQDGRPTPDKLSTALGGPVDGCAAEYRIFPATGVIKAPAHLNDAQAASLPCAGLTAWKAISGVGPGERVLIQGTGGVSLFALQFAKLAGAEVIVLSSSDDKLEKAKALGADHGINYRETPKWSRAVREISDGGVDHVVEVGGAGTLENSLKSIRMGGHIAMIGVLSGAVKDLQVYFMIGSNAHIRGITVGSAADFAAMNRALSLSQMAPVVGREMALDEIGAALELMQKGGHFGKIALNIAG